MANKGVWVTTPFSEKIALLQNTLNILPSLQDEFMELATKNKRNKIPHEEWGVFVIPIVRFMKSSINMLENLAKCNKDHKQGDPVKFPGVSQAKKDHDHFVVPIFPVTNWDMLAYPGVSGDVWIQKDQEIKQGKEFNDTPSTGLVALVLGAGNQASIPVLDILHKLYNCNQVVYLKHNPVNEWLYPIVDKLMAPFISKGLVAHSRGGINEAVYLISKCDNIHITGSVRTHDIIVWGNNIDTTRSTRLKQRNDFRIRMCNSQYYISRKLF